MPESDILSDISDASANERLTAVLRLKIHLDDPRFMAALRESDDSVCRQRLTTLAVECRLDVSRILSEPVKVSGFGKNPRWSSTTVTE